MTHNLHHTASTREVVVIGPVLPYRGGISQYNTALMRSMLRLHLSRIGVSFSRQYPRWLYPGKSDVDSALPNHVEEGIVYSIDSINPITWWRTYRNILRRAPALVVFHWWTIFWGPCFLLIASLLKRKGIQIAFICHNLEDHDATGIKSSVARHALSMADAYLVHSTEHLNILRSRYPCKRVLFHPIPIYGHYPSPKGTMVKRGRLELLFFGFIRPYKGLDVLLEAMELLNDQDVYLTVVGESWGETDDLFEAVRRLGPRLELHLRYTSDEEAAEFFDRADVVVLPYRSATGSAVAAVAHRYLKPVLATRVGGLPDVVIEGETGFLVNPGDKDALAASIRSMTREETAAISIRIAAFTQRWDWDSLAVTVKSLAHTVETSISSRTCTDDR